MDYKYMSENLTRIYDAISKLNFEAYHDGKRDDDALGLLNEARLAVVKVFRYVKRMEKENESKI
jgi:hypothetical protein